VAFDETGIDANDIERTPSSHVKVKNLPKEGATTRLGHHGLDSECADGEWTSTAQRSNAYCSEAAAPARLIAVVR
jgi:hypothetical protein